MSAFADIAGLLQQHCGFSKEYVSESTLRRFAEARSLSLARYRDLLHASRPEREALLEALVVPETYFFRHPESFDAMRDWVSRHPGRPIRILSLACSTGEEPYSIVLSLLQDGLAPENFSVEAWDLSPRAVATAMAGIYSANSFRGRDLAWRQIHFLPTGRGWEISERVRSLVHFRQGNLFDLQAISAFDIIFCRNVLIYFSAFQQRRALAGITRALTDDGILFLGPAEPLLLPAPEWRLAAYPMSFSCEKRAAQADCPKRTGKNVQEIARPVPLSPPESAPLRPAECLAEAARLADRGRLAEAKTLLQEALAAEPHNPQAHCLLGIVEEAAGEPDLAETCYRRAIYLDPSHTDALQHMVLLLEQQGRIQAAEQWRRRACKHASP